MIDEETAIVMCYTGWNQEMAKAAIVQWRAAEVGWDAECMRRYLSIRDLERLERLTKENNGVPAQGALAEIEARLAELEPEKKAANGIEEDAE